MNTLLIVGANGFIGKIFCENFINKKLKKWNITEITLISNKFDKLNKFKNCKNIKFIKSNLKDIKILKNYTNVIYAIRSSSYKEDKLVFSNFCTLAIKYLKNAKISYMSSGSVYGPNLIKNKIKENQEINTSRYNIYKNYKNIYSKIKFANEKKLIKLSNSTKCISILRCFSFVGKNLLNENDYLLSALHNNKKKLFLNKNTYRSYMNEKDLLNWILTINFFNKKFNIFNVGSDKYYSMVEVVKFFSLLKKINCNVEFVNDKIDFYIPNTSKAKFFFNLKHVSDLKKNLSRC